MIRLTPEQIDDVHDEARAESAARRRDRLHRIHGVIFLLLGALFCLWLLTLRVRNETYLLLSTPYLLWLLIEWKREREGRL